jgi:hypothetical protein
MSGNDDKVLLDLNAPVFQSALFDLDANEVRKMFKTFRKLRGLTWNEVFRDRGLYWEEIKSRPGLYSIRASRSFRAVVTREGGWMRFAALHPDHDGAYGN